MSAESNIKWEAIQPSLKEVGSVAKTTALVLVEISVASPGARATREPLLGDRFLAHFIDALIVHGFSLYCAQLFTLLMTWVLQGTYGARGPAAVKTLAMYFGYTQLTIWAICFLVFSFVYVVGLTHLRGRTLGKAFLGIRICDRSTGANPSMKQGMIRWACYFLSYATAGVPLVLQLLYTRSYGYHESWSDTFISSDEQR